ncbi:Putative tyrosinase copper-binding domain, di-copper centre-containing domain superfamily [Septoria linicola]|uniref:Tyrosinase copper-binding domain, di-copper centre-containing domain superfamily n=1 Tax=Septoria linicola TaxID=215465 RepID=A0A9Q9AV04_9PEZI|nr:putative tyrosinase copper-binding domain, di-copper centre-containing domain superfamily [Septoria linicola]USW55640.1 Putative tyrosinase copper-binding domain, di-copper centre-containing domain superfamily [Septoria linicola]
MPNGYGVPGARSIWEELQWAHIKSKNWIHGVPAFLPWHRYYLRAHELLLAEHCNYNLGTPYWEEARDVANLAGAAVWDAQFGFGGDGRAGDDCVASGPFSNLTLVFNGDGIAGPPDCLKRRFDPIAFNRAAQSEIDICLRSPDWAGASGCYENWVHIAGHEGVGQTMADALLAPGDPIFFLHHANIDRMWWQWQLAGLPRRLSEMGRPNTPGHDFNTANQWAQPGPEWTATSGDNGPETTLNHVLWIAEIVPNATIGQVMDLRGPVACANYV